MYSKLIVYQKAKALVLNVYKVSRLFPQSELHGLTSQIRRAAVSIPLNIAEGQARKGTKQYLNFLRIASGSTAEVKVCLEIALELNYLKEEEFNTLFFLSEEVSKLLYSFQKSLSSDL